MRNGPVDLAMATIPTCRVSCRVCKLIFFFVKKKSKALEKPRYVPLYGNQDCVCHSSENQDCVTLLGQGLIEFETPSEALFTNYYWALSFIEFDQPASTAPPTHD